MTNTTAAPDFAPRYYVIDQALRAQVAQSRPHDTLPSEADLCKQFKVSRMTARAAVMRLVADGLVYREPGRGTFVAAPSTRRRAETLVRFSEEVRRQGKSPTSRLVARELCPGTPEQVDKLQLSSGAEVLCITRVRLADGVPIALERAVFPEALAALLEVDLETGSLHAALEALGHIPALGYASLSARNATTAEATLLEIPRKTALLVEHRLIYDQGGPPLELTESCYVGERYALDVAFDVQHTS